MEQVRKLAGAGLGLGLVMVLQSGCASNAPVLKPVAQEETPPQLAAKPAAVSDVQSPSGKVVEVINVGNYTYVNLEKDGQKSWAAIPHSEITVGQEIEVRAGTQMGTFVSKSLNRTFENIVFSSGLVTDAKEATDTLPAGHPSLTGGAHAASAPEGQMPPGHMGMTAPPANAPVGLSGKVVETMDSGGYTYVCIENGGKKTWAAVPTTKVSVGQEVKLQSGPVMTNFSSKTLNRTFDSVIFSSGVLPAEK